MGGLVFACLAPHGSMLIPALAGEQGHKALATRTAMEELGRRLGESRPETVVVMTPHGHRVDGAFSLLNNHRVRGELGPESDGSGHSLTLLCTVDKELNTALIEAAHALEVPVTRIGYAVADDPAYYQPLDWGATVPLWFLGALLHPPPKVVIACPDRGNMPWDLFPRFGLAIRQAAVSLDRRVALVASADLGHAHDAEGPYGSDPAASEFDAAVMEAIKRQDLGRLLTVEQAWLQRAHTDAYGQLLTLHGALEDTNFRPEVLSYEVPTYFGMMCVAYEPPPGAPGLPIA